MLTKTDLNAMRKVIREEVEGEIRDAKQTLDTNIRLSRIQIQGDIRGLDDRVKNVELGVNKLEKDMKSNKRELRYLRKTLNVVIGDYDEKDHALDKRVTEIEGHLGLSFISELPIASPVDF